MTVFPSRNDLVSKPFDKTCRSKYISWVTVNV
uniref:Uncharacterized protein n=1 Tax=Rhizophora mucronata TaxID=61149 RepID=A0A2P2QZ46_RHIMU